MSLPNVNIDFDNGNIGTVVSTADGVFGLLASAVAVATKFDLNKAYTVKGMVDVAALGIVADTDNYVLYRWLEKFYEEAGEGTELWLMGFSKDDAVSDWFTPDGTTGIVPASKLLDAANGRLSGLFTAFSPTLPYVPTITDSLDADVMLAKSKAQTFAESYADLVFAPFFVILEAYAFDGNIVTLATLLEGSDNRVGIFIGNTEKRTATPTIMGASTSVLAGRLAKIQVHVSAGRVKDGELNTLTAYILDEVPELFDIEGLHDKGYISFRTHVRKSGYYITDGRLATEETDDYHYIERRRSIDKAYKLAHNIASDEILADFDLENDGTISPFYAKTIEGAIEREISTQMTAKGELSRNKADDNDFGVLAQFDMTHNVATTNTIKLILKVRPKGYARWFDILLGFSVNL